MKILLRIAFILLFAVTAKGQYLTVTNLSGTASYGSTNVTVTSFGAFSSTPWCGVNPYWIGAFSGTTPTPGGYTFTFSHPVNAIRIYITAMDYHAESTLDTEKDELIINGSFYPLAPSNFTAWPGSCSQPAAAIVGGWVSAIVPFSSGSGGQVDVAGISISSVSVNTNGYYNGNCFTFEFLPGPANNGPICSGDTLKLFWNDTASATYFWYGPAGFTSTLQDPVIPAATVADTGLYYVVRTVGGASDTESTHVIVKPNPVVTTPVSTSICQGVSNTLNLLASSGPASETYSWTGPNSFTSSIQNPSFTGFVAADTGYYVVTATLNGCTATDSTHVILAPVPPSPIITGDTVYCTGNTFVPFTVTGTGILWYTTPTGGVGTPTAPVVSMSYGGTYTFYASQTILGCESNRDSITVTVHITPPPPPVTGTSAYCQYVPYIPPTATGTNVIWYTTPTGGSSASTPPVINTSSAATYGIYATQSDSGCTSPRAAFIVTVNPLPAPPVISASPNDYCFGQTFVPFNIVSGTDVQWYTSASGGSGTSTAPVINTFAPGVYTSWATQTLLGCESARTPVTVVVYPKIIPDFAYTVHYGCTADTVAFTNTSQNAASYLWTFGDAKSSNAVNTSHIYTSQQMDTVILYAHYASCVATYTQIINLDHPLHAYFSENPNLVCQGSTVTFTDSSVGTSLNYIWNFGDNSVSTLASNMHTYPHTGVYKVYEAITDFVPCHDTAYAIVSVDSISPIHIDLTDPVVCKSASATFTGIYSPIGNTGVVWNEGNGDSTANVNPLVFAYDGVGTFTVSVRAYYRTCPDTSANIVIHVLPSPSLFLGPDTSICKGSEAYVIADNTNAGNPAATWLWSTGATTPAIEVTAPGTYSATVKVDGCTASGSVTVKNNCYMTIPNAFTPNGDGIDDYFFPRQLLTSGLISFNMNIYNRWGELIFTSTSLDGSGWDGKLNGQLQPEGVYVYVIDATFHDGQKEHHQGNITLLR